MAFEICSIMIYILIGTVSIKRAAMYVGAMFRFKGAAGGWRNFVMSLVHFWL